MPVKAPKAAVERPRRALAFALRSADIDVGGWRWTSHSPTGSDPEGSSPNERGSGRSSASHPPFRSGAAAPPPVGGDRGRADRMAGAPLPAYGGVLRRLAGPQAANPFIATWRAAARP